jgi:mycofactocin precursor peptide peptidase
VVRLAAAQPGNTTPLAELLPTLVRGGVAAASPNGVLGDPTGATAEEGEELLGTLTAQLRDALARWQPTPAGRLQH